MLSPLADAGTPVFSPRGTSHGSEGPQSPEREPHPAWMSDFLVPLEHFPLHFLSSPHLSLSEKYPPHLQDPGRLSPRASLRTVREFRSPSSGSWHFANIDRSPLGAETGQVTAPRWSMTLSTSTSGTVGAYHLGSIRGDDPGCKHRRQLGEGRLRSRVGGRPVRVISISLTTFP